LVVIGLQVTGIGLVMVGDNF